MNIRKTAIITGGNKGIGNAIVNKFAENNFNLILCTRVDFKKECLELKKKYNIDCENYIFDFKDSKKVIDTAKAIVNSNSEIDVLINNAGTISTGLFQLSNIEEFREIFEVNFFSQVFFTQIIIQKLKKSSLRSIINISSTSGVDCNIGRVSYNCSKAAMIAFTKSLSKDLAISKIRVNCVAPGLIETDMMRKSTPEKTLDILVKNNLSARLGMPKEIADLVLFLASDKSSYINGQVIRIDGGMTS
jgi:3-oxoacyl-[acyl-carrier protein] reductase